MAFDAIQEFKNLLAIIHGDGGHYTNKFGMELSILEAISIIYRDRLVLNELRDKMVDAWHDSNKENGQLHEYLGMSWEEYTKWVRGF